jgi:hypothetical protein
MNLSELPLPFWVAVFTSLGAGLWFWGQRQTGFGIPAMAVLGTVALWYFGDALYNDYSQMRSQFTDDVLILAWWQVVLFMVVFSLLVPRIHLSMNRKLRGRGSQILHFVTDREIENPLFQSMIDRFLGPLLTAWGLLMALALVRVDFDVLGLFLPWLGHKAEPWSRDRVGGGFDALLSLCQYVQIFLTASFGILAGVARRPKTRFIAIFVCLIAMPFFLFDRTRNTMLSTVLPGLLGWVFLGMRGQAIARFAVLASALLAIEAWFSFVMKSRGEGRSVATAFAEESTDAGEEEEAVNEKTKHRGLNMFEELAWMNTFIKSGDYTPNLGKRYFAELVNPIPRSLWPGKPLIGIDYAKARGFGGGKTKSAGVVASVSTGMIGQGVNNFGRFFGPLASALLMAVWVGLLARQDLLSRGEPARLLLYGLGLVLTFNLGRDITLLVLYPFLFGSLLYWWWDRFLRKRPVAPAFPKVAVAPAPPASSKSPLSDLEKESKPRKRRLRPFDFDNESPEAKKPRREPERETPPVPSVSPPTTPPEGFFDDDKSSR